MNRTSKLSLYVSLLVCLVLNPIHYSLADGGGGGGFPSQNIQRFDPVEKYQEGLAHLKDKRYKKAQAAFKKVLTVAKRDANSHFFLGLAYYEDNKVKKARRPFERAIKYDQDNVLARGYLGAVYMLLGKDEKASQQKQTLTDMKLACDNCAESKKIDQSLQLIENAQNSTQTSMQIDIESINTGDQAYLTAVKYINQGKYSIALESLKKSAMRFGPHPDVLTYQGFANRKLGNYEVALNFYQQALAVDDSHKGVNEYLGEYYVETGNMQAAKKQLAKLEKICSFGCEEAEELRRWITAASNN